MNKPVSKYRPLWEYLAGNKKEELCLSFEEAGIILGFTLDHSFLNFKKELAAFGYEVAKISLKAKTIFFRSKPGESKTTARPPARRPPTTRHRS